jgi:hypothetical protein
VTGHYDAVWSRRLTVFFAVVLVLGGCTNDDPNVTKGELQTWLEDGNSDTEAADPRCVLDPMWEAGLSDAELQEFIDLGKTGEMPSQVGVYTAIRDECNVSSLAAQCRAGDRAPIECQGALRAHLEVPSVIVAGEQPLGEVVVENDTGNTLRTSGCGSMFQVRLHRDGVRELDVTWQDCLEDFLVPMGASRWPVDVPTVLLNPDGVLPPGEYEARVHQNTNEIVTIEPVTVTVIERT